MTSFFIATLLGITAVQASPILSLRQTITHLSVSEIDAFSPYTHFAAAAYCDALVVKSWNCGGHCANNPDFKPLSSGGDGNSVQFWYVGYEPSLKTVIVAHQGTNETKFHSIVTDLDIFLKKLHPSLFPGIPSRIRVHSGFQREHAKTALNILSSVRLALSNYGTRSVTMVGHSLGAALALLDAVYLPLHLPAGTTFRSILYGLPRVGNKNFANYVDAITNLRVTRITNKKDFIPIMPGRFFGYRHPSGEVHIKSSAPSEWAACPGQENQDKLCIDGTVPTIFSGNINDHDGPYNGIETTCLG